MWCYLIRVISSGILTLQELELLEGAIFSRGDHIKSLGLYAAGEEGLDFELDSMVNLEPNILEERTVGKSSDLSLDDCSKSRTAIKSWDDFKTEFDDVFKETEEKVASGQLDSLPLTPRSTDVGQDLIIEMITSLHDSRQSAGEVERESGPKWILPVPPDSASSQTCSQSSPTRPRKPLLSLGTLETIHESEIDRLLESIEKTPDPKHNPRTGTDSDFCSLTDSGTASPSSPHPRLAWGMQEGSTSDSGNDELMKQLFELSLTQADGHQGLGEGNGEGKGAPSLIGHQLSSPQTNHYPPTETSGHLNGKVVSTLLGLDLAASCNLAE